MCVTQELVSPQVHLNLTSLTGSRWRGNRLICILYYAIQRLCAALALPDALKGTMITGSATRGKIVVDSLSPPSELGCVHTDGIGEVND